MRVWGEVSLTILQVKVCYDPLALMTRVDC
jgi:hypothetical protein